MARKTNTTTAPATIAAKERAAEALRLRVQGHSFAAIAELAGYKSRQAAYDATRRAIREILREPVEELIELDIARLDELWRAQYPAAVAGDVVALNACLRILERRAKLLGLDAKEAQEQVATPAQTVMLVPFFQDPSEWEAAAVAQQARLKEDVRK